MKQNTNNAPKLPRFVAPKNMASRVFLDKKHKMNSRQALKRMIEI